MGADPVSMSLMAVAAVTGAVGQIGEAYYNAAVARNNASIAQYAAKTKILEGQRAEEVQRLKTGLVLGSQKAAFAGSGVDVGSGSVADTLANTAMMGELDALTLRYNAESESAALRYQARTLHSQANQMITAGWIKAGASLLGAAGGGVADKWMNFASGSGVGSDITGAGSLVGTSGATGPPTALLGAG